LVAAPATVELPSASTISALRRELQGREPAPRLLAVFADPVFDADDPRVKPKSGASAKSHPQPTLARSDGGRILEHLADDSTLHVAASRLMIPRLPYTRQEAERILKAASGGEDFEALDFRASLATATSAELSRYRYLHFATHGYLDSEHPELSAIVLSLVDPNGNPEPGFLRASDIYNLKLPAELVVLSACQTGLGKEIRGEGIVGLTRGFMYAGAARVDVSLWSVNDKATEELMAIFYQKLLREKITPAAALREAQVEMYHQKQWASPYYWAAFVQQGEWR
jgi:CHAT domain-containing protein